MANSLRGKVKEATVNESTECQLLNVQQSDDNSEPRPSGSSPKQKAIQNDCQPSTSKNLTHLPLLPQSSRSTESSDDDIILLEDSSDDSDEDAHPEDCDCHICTETFFLNGEMSNDPVKTPTIIKLNFPSGKYPPPVNPIPSYKRPKLQQFFDCPSCAMSFGEKAEFVDHVHRHKAKAERQASQSQARPYGIFKCFICAKVFATKQNLKDHIRNIHYGIRDHCGICNKWFSNQWQLRCHAKIHTGENATILFIEKSNLKNLDL